MFLSCCIHFLWCSFRLHASSFHSALISFYVPFMCIHVLSFSFQIPFMFIPMCIQFLSSSFHLHAFSFHCAFISFQRLWNWLYGLAIGPSATNGVIAKSSLRLSLNKPFKWLVGGAITILKNMGSSMGRIIPDILENKECLKPPTRWHCSKDIFHQTTERERERERASWMPNDMVQYLQETGHQRWNFSHRFCQLGKCAQQHLLGLRQV